MQPLPSNYIKPEGAGRSDQLLTHLSRHKELISLPSGSFIIVTDVVTGFCFIFDWRKATDVERALFNLS